MSGRRFYNVSAVRFTKNKNRSTYELTVSVYSLASATQIIRNYMTCIIFLSSPRLLLPCPSRISFPSPFLSVLFFFLSFVFITIGKLLPLNITALWSCVVLFSFLNISRQNMRRMSFPYIYVYTLYSYMYVYTFPRDRNEKLIPKVKKATTNINHYYMPLVFISTRI